MPSQGCNASLRRLPLEKGVWLVKNSRVKVVWDFVLALLEGERRRLAPV